RVEQIHYGLCPKCSGPGPVDVHVSYRVWSVLIVTTWSNKPQISCRRCGVRSQLASAGVSAVVGWWGFPWGLVMTPVQVTRNIVAAARGGGPTQPSAELERMVRLAMVGEQAAPARGLDPLSDSALDAGIVLEPDTSCIGRGASGSAGLRPETRR